ncbi:hypothetical protein D3C84_1187980 [compost metagenome]
MGQHGVGAQQILRDGLMALGGLVEGLHIQAVALAEEQIKQLGHIATGGGLGEGHTDGAVQIRAQVDAEPLGLGNQL